MKTEIVKKIVIALIVLILCFPIVGNMLANNALKTIKADKFNSTVDSTQNYQFALVYAASGSGSNTDSVKDEIRDVIKEYREQDMEISAYFMDYDEMTSDERAKIYGDLSDSSAYFFISNGEIIKTISGTMSSSKLEALVQEYSVNGIDDEYKYYKTVSDSSSFKKLIDRKKDITMAVFGRDNCYYCNQFGPVINTVAEENKVDIYYFDKNNYDADEYEKIMNLGIKIPASCTDDGEIADLKDGFGTPLTLFFKAGKVIDCISGYNNKSTLISKLETVGMIETAEK